MSSGISLSHSSSSTAPTCDLAPLPSDVLAGLHNEEGKLPGVLVQTALDGHAQVEVTDQDALVRRMDCVHPFDGVDLGCAAELAASTHCSTGYRQRYIVWFAN